MSNGHYCFCADKEYKDVLISFGYKLLKFEEISDTKVWIFLNDSNENYSKIDTTKCFFSNKRYF